MDKTELSKMLKDLLNLERGLTDWEVEFIEAMSKRAKTSKAFSPSMSDKIEQLWYKHF